MTPEGKWNSHQRACCGGSPELGGDRERPGGPLGLLVGARQLALSVLSVWSQVPLGVTQLHAVTTHLGLRNPSIARETESQHCHTAQGTHWSLWEGQLWSVVATVRPRTPGMKS